MVQVDLFLTYGIGAAFALAAAPANHAAHAAPRQQSLPALTAMLLYLSLLFVPSGLWLLRQFPAWETMHVLPHPPPWLPTTFAVGVVMAGAAGFGTTRILLRRGAPWAAVLQWIWPVLTVYLIFLHGWDGMGAHRLLTADAAHWPTTAHQPLGALAARWITTPVAHTLGGMLAIAVPVLFALLRHVRLTALRTRTAGPHTTAAAATRFAGTVLGTVAVLCGLAATGLHLLLTAVGPLIGAATFLIAALALLHPRSPLAQSLVSRCLPSPVTATTDAPPAPSPGQAEAAGTHH